jgi:hypothetical protein
LLVASFAGAAELEVLFEKGAEWHLFVDDWDGTMIVQDHRVSNDASGTKLVTATVEWKSQRGSFQAREYTRDPRRSIVLSITLPNGEQVEAEGSLGRETDDFMAGVTRYAQSEITYYGAWYANLLAAGESRELAVSGGVIQDLNSQAMTVRATCQLAGAVSGLTQQIRSVSLQPANSNQGPVELDIAADGQFSTNALAVGSYRFALVPYGKLDLAGPGVSQDFDCVAGGSVRLSAEVNSVSE